jgi:hypothetical protein
VQPAVQVNTDASGADVVGDAANEPSIAVDPLAPNRMAIGWRQFDTTSSAFREAGWAWTNDGGRTWHFEGVLEDGAFRSDPVLASNAEGTFFYCSLKEDFTADLWRSDDGGQTFTAPVALAGGDKPWIAIDRTGGIGHGNIYAAWVQGGLAGDKIFTRSVDGGLTFQPPVEIPNPPRLGTVAVGVNGAVYVVGVKSAPYNPNIFYCRRSLNAQNPEAVVTFDLSSTVNMGGALVDGGVPNPTGLLGQAWVDVDRSTGPFAGSIYMLSTVRPFNGSATRPTCTSCAATTAAPRGRRPSASTTMRPTITRTSGSARSPWRRPAGSTPSGATPAPIRPASSPSSTTRTRSTAVRRGRRTCPSRRRGTPPSAGRRRRRSATTTTWSPTRWASTWRSRARSRRAGRLLPADRSVRLQRQRCAGRARHRVRRVRRLQRQRDSGHVRHRGRRAHRRRLRRHAGPVRRAHG